MSRNEWQRWYDSPYALQVNDLPITSLQQEFIKRLLVLLHPAAGDRLLVTGCGTGELASLIADSGIDTTATDYSQQAIGEALARQHDSLHFYQHDLRLPFWSNFFQVAFSLFDSFGYYDTRREQENMIRTIAGSLKANGKLVIDYRNDHYLQARVQSSALPDLSRKIPGREVLFTEWTDEAHAYRRITITGEDGEKEEFVEQRDRFTLGDLTDMLSFQQLQIQEVFGDYDFTPYDVRKSPRMILIAKKLSPAPADGEKRIYSDGRTTDPLT